MCLWRPSIVHEYCMKNPGDIVEKSTNDDMCNKSVYPRTPSSQHLYSGDPAYDFHAKLF